MNYLIETFIFIFLISFLSVGILAQDSQKTKYESRIPENKKCSLPGDYKNFNQIEFKEFTLCIPVELKREIKKCIDGDCNTFKSEEMVLDIDLSADAWKPTFERTFPSYKEDNNFIDNKKSWIWYFEQEYYLKSVLGANYQSGKHDYYDLGVFVFYKDPNQKDVAEKIIKSVRFKQ